jgi:hypothetical protein
MAEPLINVILASILHLIRQYLTWNRRAPPCWAPPRWAPAHQDPRRICRSKPRAVTPPPSYRPMEPSPPTPNGPPLSGPPLPPLPYNPRTQVNLGRLAKSPEGITSFMVAGPRRTPATEEERGSPAVEPLTRGMTDLMSSD